MENEDDIVGNIIYIYFIFLRKCIKGSEHKLLVAKKDMDGRVEKDECDFPCCFFAGFFFFF